MARILFLSHRLPYPPDKGDKIHSYHVLRHLARRHEVFLGTFVDDAADLQYLDTVRLLCPRMHVARLTQWRGAARAAAGMLRGAAVTTSFFNDPGLRTWVDRLRRSGEVDLVFVYSAAMVAYAASFDVPVWIDFTDVDSAKWSRFAQTSNGATAWLYAREARCLQRLERTAAAGAQKVFFVSEREAALFRAFAPESADRVGLLTNGVDHEFFKLDAGRPNPFAAAELPIVFTGKMDYRPNVDAVVWFATDVLPRLRMHRPQVRLHVVGRQPNAAVKALQGDAVAVTGAVPDVRPYLQHAALAVAPMRLANGMQNKVLEAMAMQRAVVTAPECAQAIGARSGIDLLTAANANEYVRAVERLLDHPLEAARMGAAARACMRERHDWERCLSVLDGPLAALQVTTPVPRATTSGRPSSDLRCVA